MDSFSPWNVSTGCVFDGKPHLSLLTQLQMGIGAALTAIIGQNMGAGLYDRAHAIFEPSVTMECSLVSRQLKRYHRLLLPVTNSGSVH